MEDDILDSYLNSTEEAFSTPEQKNDGGNKKQFNKNREDLWNKDDWKPVKMRREDFSKSGKSCIINLASTPTDDVKKVINSIVVALGTKNVTVRFQYDTNISFYKELCNIDTAKTEKYLPWKKMAPDLESVTKTYAEKKAYEYAAYFVKKFNGLPAAIRTMRANMIHALLGKDLNNPIDFALVWNELGTEVLTKDTDWKKVGNITNVLQVCKELDIPVYNIKNKESVQKLVDKIKEF